MAAIRRNRTGDAAQDRRALELAFRTCDCTGNLDDALRFPALAIALKNVAQAIVSRRPIPTPRFDVKRVAAGDFDD